MKRNNKYMKYLLESVSKLKGHSKNVVFCFFKYKIKFVIKHCREEESLISAF